jgi:hypothetical protein
LSAISTEILQVPLSSIKETPENWDIYNRPGIEPEFTALVDSIRKHGIETPLHISDDNYIVSGHRRHAAGIVAGIKSVEVIRLGFSMESKMPSERVGILIEHNRGSRHKTEQEMVREAMAEVDPESAVIEAENRRTQHLSKINCLFGVIEARGKINRSGTGGARSEFLEAVLTIIEEMESNGLLPTNGRAIHYKLLQRKVRTSTYASGHVYGEHWEKNKKTGALELKDSSPALYKLLTDARAEGIIDDAWITDETRPVWIPHLHNSPAQYLGEEVDSLFTGYFSNPHKDQDSHIEIMVEKNTIYPMIQRRVAAPLRLPISSCRGYSSGSQRARVIERFMASGKKHLTIIYAGDHDPDGIEMPKSLVKYMESDLGIKPKIIRAAVNTDQIKKYGLLPDMEAKKTSTRFKPYFKQTGLTDAWEIDSMDPGVLVKEITNACKSVIDIDIFNAALEQEKQDDIRLAKLRAATIRFIQDNSSIINRP